MLVDGVGADVLADALVPGLAAAGRAPLRVRSGDFWRPAGERFSYGREDAQAYREHWLDAAALEREVLGRDDSVLPALRDVGRDRSARRERVALGKRSVLLVDGVLLLGRGLTADLVIHLALTPAALLRRGVPAWQLPAHADYARDARPADSCDVLVRAEDPLRPAVLLRQSP